MSTDSKIGDGPPAPAIVPESTPETTIQLLKAIFSGSQLAGKPFLTVAEASKISGLSVQYLQKMIDSGQLKSVPDTPPRIKRTDLLKWSE